MWKRSVAGRALTFHLAGINNQNFLMRDEETGSFWQQVTGRAIAGPMKGAALELASTDEVTFRVFRAEEPRGTVLATVAKYAGRYAKADWDTHMAKTATVLSYPESGIGARELMLGVEAGTASRAFPLARVLANKVVQDRVGAQPIVLVVGPDRSSVRGFVAQMDGKDAAAPAPNGRCSIRPGPASGISAAAPSAARRKGSASSPSACWTIGSTGRTTIPLPPFTLAE